MNDRPRSTTKTPMIEHRTPMISDAVSARCMNPKVKKSNTVQIPPAPLCQRGALQPLPPAPLRQRFPRQHLRRGPRGEEPRLEQDQAVRDLADQVDVVRDEQDRE